MITRNIGEKRTQALGTSHVRVSKSRSAIGVRFEIIDL